MSLTAGGKPVNVPYECDILFFTRGKGRGHAVPDVAIAQDLLARDPNIKITFVSYDRGAETIRGLKWHVVDLHLPEEPPLWDITSLAIQICRQCRPLLVVSHEEFAALPVSRAFGYRTLFLTDWFGDPSWTTTLALKCADEIVFLDDPGYDALPEYVEGKVFYAGRVLRPLRAISRQDARTALNISNDSTVLLVVAGGSRMHRESQSPILDLITEAFAMLEINKKQLLWVESNDADKCVRSLRDVTWIQPDYSAFTDLLVASDLVITTGNRTPIIECSALGIPSVTVSFGHNAVDDIKVTRLASNIALRARGLHSAVLRDHMVRALKRTDVTPWANGLADRGRMATVDRLYHQLQMATDRTRSEDAARSREKC